jgi:hypothetical protein
MVSGMHASPNYCHSIENVALLLVGVPFKKEDSPYSIKLSRHNPNPTQSHPQYRPIQPFLMEYQPQQE